MKSKNKTFIMFILVLAAITLCYSQVLADNEWLDRNITDDNKDVCFSTSSDQDNPQNGWIVCRDEINGSFPQIDSDKGLALFNYAVVPGLGCDNQASYCPTWSFFMLYLQDIVADSYFVTTSPKGATLEKDPVPQCDDEFPNLTGIKWNPKVNLKQFKNPEEPVKFSLTTKIGIGTGTLCVEPLVVSSSSCAGGDLPGPKLNFGFLQNTRTYTCTNQGDGEDETITLTVEYDECDGSPNNFTALKIMPNGSFLELPPPEEVTNPYFYMREKDPDDPADPQIRAFPVSDVGPYSGALMCSEKVASTPSGQNLPFFVWGNQVWFIEQQLPPPAPE